MQKAVVWRKKDGKDRIFMDIVENKEKLVAYRERAKALVAQMTLEEKVSQTLHRAPAIERLGIKAYNWWNEALHGVARAGVATVFPQAIALAATFDEILWSRWQMPSPRRAGQSSICSKSMTTGIFIKD